MYQKKKNEDGKFEMCYLLDKVMGFEENQRLTEDAMVKVYEEAVQTSIDVEGVCKRIGQYKQNRGKRYASQNKIS